MEKKDRPINVELPPGFNATSAILDANVSRGCGDRAAIYYRDEKLTYRDTQKMANKLGNALKDLGIDMENRVAILLPDCPRWIASFWGTLKIGAVSVPLNTMMRPAHYEYFLNDTRAKAIIVGEDFIPQIKAIKHNLHYLKHIIVAGNADEGQLSYDRLVEIASPELEAAGTCKDDVSYWLYTSGTTGPPKGTIHLHHDIIHASRFTYRDVFGIREDDIIFSVARLFFSYGLTNMTGTFYNGAAIILDPERPQSERVLKIITRYKPSVLCGVPTFFANLLALKNIEGYDLSSIRLAISAGEALPPGVYYGFKERFGIDIVEGIGSTEACAWYIANRPGNVRAGSTGKVVPGG